MIFDQIRKLNNIAERLRNEEPHSLVFYKGAFPDPTDKATLQFEAIGNKIFYNNEFKKFPNALLEFLRGDYNITVLPLSQGMLTNIIIYFDFDQLVLETIRKISSKKISQFIDTSKPILVSRNNSVTSISVDIAENLQEKAALFYFNFSQKTVAQFLRDFPTTNQYSFLITLLILMYLQYLTLQYTDFVEGGNKNLENLYSIGQKKVDVNQTKQVSVRINNLKKILQKVKQL